MSPDAAYYRQWRASNPEYRARQNELRNLRRRLKGRESRILEYAKRKSRAVEPLGELFPHLVKGTKLIFWEEELQRDLVQVRALAELEGHNVEEAVKAFVRWEHAWRKQVVTFIAEFNKFEMTREDQALQDELERWQRITGGF